MKNKILLWCRLINEFSGERRAINSPGAAQLISSLHGPLRRIKWRSQIPSQAINKRCFELTDSKVSSLDVMTYKVNELKNKLEKSLILLKLWYIFTAPSYLFKY